jgi:ribonuclease HI
MNRLKLLETVTDSQYQILNHYLKEVDDERLLHDATELLEALWDLIPREEKINYRWIFD